MRKTSIAFLSLCVLLSGCREMRNGTVEMIVKDLDTTATVRFYVDRTMMKDYTLDAGKSVNYIAHGDHTACVEVDNGQISAAFRHEIPLNINTFFTVSQEGNDYVVLPYLKDKDAFPKVTRLENCTP